MESYSNTDFSPSPLAINDWETAWKKVSSGVTEHLESLDELKVNQKPSSGGWSAAQVAWHVWKSESNILMLMHGKVILPARDPSSLINQLKQDFSDRNIKMESPSWIDPREKQYNREELLNGLEKTQAEAVSAAATLDLTHICIDFEFPVYGHLSRLELLYFMLVHKERHLYQLRSIV